MSLTNFKLPAEHLLSLENLEKGTVVILETLVFKVLQKLWCSSYRTQTEQSVRCSMELGTVTLKRIGFFCFLRKDWESELVRGVWVPSKNLNLPRVAAGESCCIRRGVEPRRFEKQKGPPTVMPRFSPSPQGLSLLLAGACWSADQHHDPGVPSMSTVS